jgi:hypothetical protein
MERQTSNPETLREQAAQYQLSTFQQNRSELSGGREGLSVERFPYASERAPDRRPWLDSESGFERTDSDARG